MHLVEKLASNGARSGTEMRVHSLELQSSKSRSGFYLETGDASQKLPKVLLIFVKKKKNKWESRQSGKQQGSISIIICLRVNFSQVSFHRPISNCIDLT